MHVQLELLKFVHLVIVAACLWAVGYLLFRGATGGGGTMLLVALALPAAIGLGRYANGVECILQTWARQMQGVPKGQWARDILWLPESWARAIPGVVTPLYALGAGLVAGRFLERMASG